MSLFQPHNSEFQQNPYPAFEALRVDGPAFWDEASSMWYFLNHADVDGLLRERRLGREPLGGLPAAAESAFEMLNQHSMFDMEPPDHTRLKTLVHKVFTPRRVESLRAQIAAECERLLDAAAAAGGMEALADYAAPLPVAVIAELLGVPAADRHKLRPWSAAIVAMYELAPSAAVAAAAETASAEFSEYLRALSRARQKTPGDDLISALAQVQEEGARLSEDELIATCVLLLNAGHEATTNAFGNGLWALLRHPEQLADLRREPGRLPEAIEEMLRWDTPLQLFRRWVRTEVEIQGIRLAVGQQVGLLFGAANRDPAVFAQPEAFDIRRGPTPHLAFGAGIHYCLGAPLARLELQLSFAALLRRFPTMRLAGAEPAYAPRFVIRGLEELRVEF